MIRPYLLIDVDGVLNPFGSGAKPDGFCHELMGYEVWLSLRHGLWLNQLAAWFDLVWATTWEHDAPRLIAPMELSTDLAVIEFGQDAADETWKLHDVARFVGNRALAWINDDLVLVAIGSGFLASCVVYIGFFYGDHAGKVCFAFRQKPTEVQPRRPVTDYRPERRRRLVAPPSHGQSSRRAPTRTLATHGTTFGTSTPER